MKKLLLLFIALGFAFTLFGCKKIQFDETKGELVIGLECDYSPFNWTETEKTDDNVEIYGQTNLYADGYDIQIAKLICDDLGLKLVVKKIAWEGLIPALESGDIDCIIAGMSPTKERKESIDFSDYYYKSEHVVIVKKGSAYENATKFSDFKGANVIGQKGTAYEELASQLASYNGENSLTPLSTIPLIISGILLGDVDVTIVEKPVALGICASNEELTYVTLEDKFEIEEEQLIVSIGLRKIDTNLKEKINASLSKITSSKREELMFNAIENGNN